MQVYTHEEWLAEAERRFGPDPKTWQFVCPRCSGVQSIQDFVDAGVSRDTVSSIFAYSCIGRFMEGKGCDWTLGGLFHIHKVEVELNGKQQAVFEFAEVAEVATSGRKK